MNWESIFKELESGKGCYDVALSHNMSVRELLDYVYPDDNNTTPSKVVTYWVRGRSVEFIAMTLHIAASIVKQMLSECNYKIPEDVGDINIVSLNNRLAEMDSETDEPVSYNTDLTGQLDLSESDLVTKLRLINTPKDALEVFVGVPVGDFHLASDDVRELYGLGYSVTEIREKIGGELSDIIRCMNPMLSVEHCELLQEICLLWRCGYSIHFIGYVLHLSDKEVVNGLQSTGYIASNVLFDYNIHYVNEELKNPSESFISAIEDKKSKIWSLKLKRYSVYTRQDKVLERVLAGHIQRRCYEQSEKVLIGEETK